MVNNERLLDVRPIKVFTDWKSETNTQIARASSVAIKSLRRPPTVIMIYTYVQFWGSGNHSRDRESTRRGWEEEKEWMENTHPLRKLFVYGFSLLSNASFGSLCLFKPGTSLDQRCSIIPFAFPAWCLRRSSFFLIPY